LKKKVTIVIPCYNQGAFLQDALDSIAACNEQFFDLIIVNDGSTDKETNEMLIRLSEQGYHVIFQENKGLGGARNAGILASETEYILPLDADNKLLPSYIEKGIKVLEEHPEVSVVYGNAKLFGDKQGELIPGPFNLQRLMLGNYIDACALVRKSALEKAGMYDRMKIMGYEDWDLWLRIAFSGGQFHYINETLFEYRVRHDSMMKSVNANVQKQNEIEAHILNKYADKLDFDYPLYRFLYQFKKKPFTILKALFYRKFFPEVYHRKVKEGRIRRFYIYD